MIKDTDAESQLEAITGEARQLREVLESMKAQAALLGAQETFLADSVTLLARLREELDAIEATDDWPRRREVIERYVRRIVVTTKDTGRRIRDAEITVHLRLKPESRAVDTSMSARFP